MGKNSIHSTIPPSSNFTTSFGETRKLYGMEHHNHMQTKTAQTHYLSEMCFRKVLNSHKVLWYCKKLSRSSTFLPQAPQFPKFQMLSALHFAKTESTWTISFLFPTFFSEPSFFHVFLKHSVMCILNVTSGGPLVLCTFCTSSPGESTGRNGRLWNENILQANYKGNGYGRWQWDVQV